MDEETRLPSRSGRPLAGQTAFADKHQRGSCREQSTFLEPRLTMRCATSVRSTRDEAVIESRDLIIIDRDNRHQHFLFELV